jgi:hypothetical protein
VVGKKAARITKAELERRAALIRVARRQEVPPRSPGSRTPKLPAANPIYARVTPDT